MFMDIWDSTMINAIHDLFWHHPFYVELYAVCLLSLALFWKQMKRGRRFFLLYSVICLIVFIYNPVFINLLSKYLLHGDRVLVRVFQLLPLLLTEAYVFTSVASAALKKSRILSVAITVAIASLLLYFGVTPWQRVEKGGWWADMYFWAENPYKIPQEHLNICDAILADMDGNRAVLSMYEMHGINDTGGTLNYSIRMYTSKIQLDEFIDIDTYSAMTLEDRTTYLNTYIAAVQAYETNNTSIYFLFPKEDIRATDLLEYGCTELVVDSENYQVLEYAPEIGV